jgi:ribulose-5-phosphate 4-epimerase/fuculose-1-phosphate aldolase
MTEADLRADIVWWGRSLFDRGLTSGTSGNISVRCGDGFLATPTNSCLGRLDAGRLSRLDGDWRLLDGDPPTKEIALHRPFYAANPGNGAVVHLHSTHATALSCRADIDTADAIRPVTPYVVMRLGVVPVLPYARPGSDVLEPRLHELAASHAGVLLGNHGPIVAGRNLTAAVSAIEELEEAAKMAHLLRDLPVRYLTTAEIAELHHHFGGR